MQKRVFELLAKMYFEMEEQFNEINDKIDKMADKSDIVRIENDLKPKIEAALDGYKVVNKRLTDILERIEKEVSNSNIPFILNYFMYSTKE